MKPNLSDRFFFVFRKKSEDSSWHYPSENSYPKGLIDLTPNGLVGFCNPRVLWGKSRLFQKAKGQIETNLKYLKNIYIVGFQKLWRFFHKKNVTFPIIMAPAKILKYSNF